FAEVGAISDAVAEETQIALVLSFNQLNRRRRKRFAQKSFEFHVCRRWEFLWINPHQLAIHAICVTTICLSVDISSLPLCTPRKQFAQGRRRSDTFHRG